MIQFYADLKDQVKEVFKSNLQGGQIQKIYSTAFYIAISIRTPGKTFWLYFGRGNGHEGIWISNLPPRSELRRKDQLLEYLRKYLISTSFLELRLDEKDRIISIDYQKYGARNSFYFFWLGRKSYFSHYFLDFKNKDYKLFKSWSKKTEQENNEFNDGFNIFDEVGRSHSLNIKAKSNLITSIDTLLEIEFEELKNLGSKKINFNERKKEKISRDIEKTQQWKIIKNFLDSRNEIQETELSFDTQKIKFSKEMNNFEKRNLLFEKIKKLKRGENIQKARLAELIDKNKITQALNDSDKKLNMYRPVWGKDEKRINHRNNIINSETKNYKLFEFSSYNVAVGLNSKGNDELRNSWAGKDDFWFHLDQQTSSHAVLKLKNTTSLTMDMINIAASIVAYFSHFNSDWIPVIYTQVKNLKGVTGVSGMVVYKKEKRIVCQKINIDECIRNN